MNPPLPTFTHLGSTVILRPASQFSKQELNSRLHQMEVQYDQTNMSKNYFKNLYENALKYDQNKIKIFDRLIKDTIIYKNLLKNNSQNFAHSPEKYVKNEKVPIIQTSFITNQTSNRSSNQNNISHNYNNSNNYTNDIQTRNDYNHETPNNNYHTKRNDSSFQKGFNQNENQNSFKNAIVNEIKKNQAAINNQNNISNNNSRNEFDNRNQQYQNSFTQQSNTDEYQTGTFGNSMMNNNTNTNNNTKYQSNYNNNSEIQTNYNSNNPNVNSFNNNQYKDQYKEQYNNSPFNEQKNYPNNQNQSNYRQYDENNNFPQKYNNQNQQSYTTNNSNIQQNNLNYSNYERKNCIVDGNSQPNNDYNNNINNINNKYQNPHGNNINPISLTIQSAVNENSTNAYNQYDNSRGGYNPNNINMQRNFNPNRRPILANNNRGIQEEDDGDGESNFTFMSKFDRIKNFFNEKENRDTCFNILQFIIIAVILAIIVRYGIRHSQTIGDKVAETAKAITDPKLFIEIIFGLIKAIIVELFWRKFYITIPLIILSIYIYHYRKNRQFEKVCKDIIEDIKKYLRTAPPDRNGNRTITIDEIINRYTRKYNIDRKIFIKKYLKQLDSLRRNDHALKESNVINERGIADKGWELSGMN